MPEEFTGSFGPRKYTYPKFKGHLRAPISPMDIRATEPVSTPRPEHREGPVARSIEQQTAKLPSDTFLWAALGSIGASLAFKMAGKHDAANFVGHWAPTILILGLYNKMVKLHGSDNDHA